MDHPDVLASNFLEMSLVLKWLIHIFHTGPESHELTRKAKYLESYSVREDLN